MTASHLKSAPQNPSFIDEPTVSIYSCYFGPAEIFENDVYKPLQVGSANCSSRLTMLQDDDGESISNLNKSFCEMTGIYWAWKNDRTSDYIGFSHYRRLFSFKNNTGQKVDAHGMIYADQIEEDFEQRFGLDAFNVKNVVLKYDMVLPHYFDVTIIDGIKSVREQYASSPSHHVQHLDLVSQIIGSTSPGDLKYLKEVFDGKYFYPANMFVMSRQLFDSYCEWIFPILFRLEKKIDVMGLGAAERRAVGFIAERLLTVFVLKQRDSSSMLTSLEVDRVFVRNPNVLPKEPPVPVTPLEVVTVVTAADENYAPHAAALCVSIASTMSEKKWLDFIILTGNLKESTRRSLKEVASFFSNVSISFVEMGYEYNSAKVHSYFTKATLYRLSLPEVLKSRNRIVFIDADGIVMEDISPFISMDLEDNIVAAVHDFTMESFQNMKVPVLAECGDMDADSYCRSYLGMRDAANSYFQAGFLVMDIEKLREQKLSKKMILDVTTRPYWFLDQDVLNRNLVNQIKFLDPKWNVVDIDTRHKRYLSNATQATLAVAEENPGFVHFAGLGKPWNGVGHPRAQVYWSCLRRTAFYEEALFQTFILRTGHGSACHGNVTRRSVVDRIRKRFAKLGRSISKRVRRHPKS